jgi:GT2 family glycosyltransferase
MHRSGTSLVARALASAGVSAGPAAQMLAAREDNPEGFYEHRELVAINDAALAGAGASWAAPARITSLPPELDERAAALLRDLAARAPGQFLLKDPRLCLSLAAWRAHLAEPSVVFVYRDGLAVARSLASRNRFPLQLGLLLWEYYNRAALGALAGTSVFAVSYDEVVAEPQRLSALVAALTEQGFDCDPEAAAATVNPSLRHAATAADDPDRLLLSDEQLELERLCTSLCAAGVGPQSVPAVGAMSKPARARLHDLSAALAPLATVVETGLERDEAQRLCDERTEERDRALREFDVLEGDHRALTKAHEEERERHQQAAAALRSLEGDYEKLVAAHDQEVAAHNSLIDDHVHLTKLHEDLLHERDDLQEKADFLFFTLTEAYRGLLTFETSTLARLQRRLRGFYRFVTRQRGQNSRYEDVLEFAHAHFDEFDIDKPLPQPRKIDMLGDVIRYVLRNPAGSARSFSWPRLKRAAQVFFGSSSADLAVWVNARFPDESARGAAFDPASLDASLDTLELQFPCVDAPQVSIIVPVYNDYRVTVNCLRSVLEHTGGIACEIIIADDCSSDLTATIAERISNVTVSRTPENLRFLRNCNLAARRARGEHLLFLNNDTEVTEGWLQSLLEVMDDPAVGVVGPKLLFADGRLQEAGGIVWKDASAWNFGRADDPAHPAYNYRRDVDYVSGACLLIRRRLWQQLGGFDERFAPAYYEDADICFAARDAGYRVVYQPRSEVFHFEGVSNGTDLTSGVKQHQVDNQAVFLDKWQHVLQAGHYPNGEEVLLARDRSRGKPRILVIDHYVPHYDKDAGGRSTDQYLQLFLKLGFQVQFMGANFFPHQPYTERLQAMGIEVLVGERIARGLDDWLAEHAPYIDEIWVHRPHVAEQFLPHLTRLKIRPELVFVGHDLHYLRMEREAALMDDPELWREAASWKKRELAVCGMFDRVCYFSQAELDELSGQVSPQKLRRIPLYAMELDPLPPYAPAAGSDILFVGGYNHPPNVDAAVWLCEEILPAIQSELPEARVHLVGSNACQQVLALAGDSVTVHGFLSDSDLDALYRRVALVIVPLRYGAGVKGKVIEAVARNVPLITTDIGAEGMPDAESVMWVENTVDAIASCAVQVLRGEADIGMRMAGYAPWLRANFAAERAAECLSLDMPVASGVAERVSACGVGG